MLAQTAMKSTEIIKMGDEDSTLKRHLKIQKSITLDLIDEVQRLVAALEVETDDNRRLRNKISALQGGYQYVTKH